MRYIINFTYFNFKCKPFLKKTNFFVDFCTKCRVFNVFFLSSHIWYFFLRCVIICITRILYPFGTIFGNVKNGGIHQWQISIVTFSLRVMPT